MSCEPLTPPLSVPDKPCSRLKGETHTAVPKPMKEPNVPQQCFSGQHVHQPYQCLWKAALLNAL